MPTVKKQFEVSLDIKRSTSNRDFEVVDGDNNNQIIVTLTDDGQPVDLTGCLLLAVFSKSDGRTAAQDTEGNGVTITGTNEATIDLYMTSFTPGLVECELQVFSGDGYRHLVTSAKFNFMCRLAIANSDTIAETDEWPVLVEMLDRIEGVEDELHALNDETANAAAEAHTAANRANEAATHAEAINADMETAEAARVAAEQGRVSGETTRVSAEGARQSAESSRVQAEGLRASAEQQRVTAEGTRQTAEAVRASTEGQRTTAESLRVIAEQGRQQTMSAFNLWEQYNPGKSYAPLNKVSHNGSSYLCIAPAQGVAPPNPSYWLLIAAKGADGSGIGDMLKSTYDTDGDGVVDDAARLGGRDAGAYLTEETDPTVPAWAKQPTKPEYTAAEVGAATPTQTLTATLPAPWSTTTQTLTIPGITPTSAMGLSDTATQPQREAARKAMLSAAYTGENTVTVTADGEVPTIDLPCQIIIWG